MSLSSVGLSALGNSTGSSASLDTFLFFFCFDFFFFGLVTVSLWSDISSVIFFSFFFFSFLVVATLSDWQVVQ